MGFALSPLDQPHPGDRPGCQAVRTPVTLPAPLPLGKWFPADYSLDLWANKTASTFDETPGSFLLVLGTSGYATYGRFACQTDGRTDRRTTVPIVGDLPWCRCLALVLIKFRHSEDSIAVQFLGLGGRYSGIHMSSDIWRHTRL